MYYCYNINLEFVKDSMSLLSCYVHIVVSLKPELGRKYSDQQLKVQMYIYYHLCMTSELEWNSVILYKFYPN